MIGRTNVGGGGNTFAFIVVTYPVGSVCTCSDGVRTIRAKDTTGSFVFNIPYAARWTVECHNDATEESDEVDVEISTKGQVENVILNYDIIIAKNDFLSFISLARIFSGASGTATEPSKEIVDNSVRFYLSTSKQSRNGMAYYPTPIDLRKYNYIKFKGSLTTGSVTDQSRRTGFFLWKSIPESNQSINDPSVLEMYAVPSGANQTYTYDGETVLDVSEKTGLCYVGFAFGQSSSGNLTEIVAEELKATR